MINNNVAGLSRTRQHRMKELPGTTFKMLHRTRGAVDQDAVANKIEMKKKKKSMATYVCKSSSRDLDKRKRSTRKYLVLAEL